MQKFNIEEVEKDLYKKNFIDLKQAYLKIACDTAINIASIAKSLEKLCELKEEEQKR